MNVLRQTVFTVALTVLVPGLSLADGKTDFVGQCARCHGVASAGITATGKRAAPDLGGSAEKGGALWIRRYVDTSVTTLPHPRPFKGSEEELQALVDWLLEQ